MDTCNLENEIVQENNIQNKHITKLKISELKCIIRDFKKKIHDNINKCQIRSKQLFYKKISNKIHDFGLVGSKQKLLERVEKIYNQEEKALLIQKNIRRLFVKQLIILRGPALRNRKICINETDFCTMQPLEEIEMFDFFSYESQLSKQIYGFDLNSLLTYYKRKGKMENPYTRESMEEYIPYMQKTYRINKILYKEKFANKSNEEIFNNNFLQTQFVRRRLNSIDLPDHYNSNEVANKLHALRQNTTQRRIDSLFIEFDHHGHYTNKDWFVQLNFGDMMRFFRILRDIWNYRSRLPFSLKIRICPLWDPFISISFNYRDLIYSQIQDYCLTAMEDITHMGIDETHRELGIFQILTAFTFVSHDARRTMPWLYESIF